MILIESIRPVGTTRKVSSLIENITNLFKKICNCLSPERADWNILSELINNDRVAKELKNRL